MAELVRYRIRCTTDNTWEYEWKKESDPVPTACPTNGGHSINSNTIAIVDRKEQKVIEVTSQPGTTDDVDHANQYQIGDEVVDTTNDKSYVCIDNSAGAAVWKDTTTTAGATGVWKGPWVSQNYVVDDLVEYNGSSYICILNTVSNEVPTNGTYWDLVASKGDTGAEGTAIVALMVAGATNGTEYQSVGDLIFPGTTAVGSPTSIKCISWGDSGTTHAVRVYDITNDAVIAEVTGLTNTAKAIASLTGIDNLPASEALWEVQLKKTAGGVPSYVHMSVLHILV